MKDSWPALPSTPVGGVDAAVSVWTAYPRDRALGEELSQEEERKYAPLAKVAQERELAAWKEFNVFCLVAQATIKKTIVNTRWVWTWEAIGGSTSAEARSVAKGSQDPDL